ncbi:MAG: ParB N-terminal domain-containing protein [Novosphingobium sp.]|nr:ParB N-terminal domain-containing protein [Novosphingobium sp.]
MTTPPVGAPGGVPDLLDTLALQVRYIPPASLSAFGRRSRTHTKDQVRRIAESIRAFGFTVPVLVDEDHKVIAGNARVEAAIQLDIAAVPVVALSHLTPAQKRAFVIAENQLATLSGWDRDVLRIEFEELGALDLDFSLEVTGFLEPQIDAIVLGDPGTDSNSDQLAPLPAMPTSRLGDLWELGDHRLLCADSTCPNSLCTLLDGEKARAVFTDAPYNVRIAGHVTGTGLHGEFVMASGEMSEDEFTRFLARSLTQISAYLVPGGIAYFCMDWRHAGNVFVALKAVDIETINLVVWDKGTGGMGSFYRSRHELIFVLRKAGAPHLNRIELGRHGRDRHNVWSYRGVNGFGTDKAREREMHPTVKPLALVRDAILDCTARGDLVLDLFSGSGTTIVAAHDSGRRGAAIELDPRYVDTGLIRWQDYAGKEARLAATGQTFREVRAERAADAAVGKAPAAGLPPARQRKRRTV